MEFVENGSLSQIIKKFGRLSESLVGLYTLQVRKFRLHLRFTPWALYVTGSNSRSTLQGVTAASSGTHTRWWEEQASSLALSRAPVCGMRRLPEGSRRYTGEVSVTL